MGRKKSRVENTGYIQWFTWKEKLRNRVGLIVDKLKQNFIDVKRPDNWIIWIKPVLGKHILICYKWLRISERIRGAY